MNEADKGIIRESGVLINESKNEKIYYYGIDLIKYILAFFIVAIHFHPFSSINENADYFVVNYLTRIAVPF